MVAAEALAVTADEAATTLPRCRQTRPQPHRRTLARLCSLLHQTSAQVGEALEENEEALAQMALVRGAKARGRSTGDGLGHAAVDWATPRSARAG